MFLRIVNYFDGRNEKHKKRCADQVKNNVRKPFLNGIDQTIFHGDCWYNVDDCNKSQQASDGRY